MTDHNNKDKDNNKCVPEFGQFCWNELMTSDPTNAKTFYENLFGWTSTEHDMGDNTYTQFSTKEKSIGGMLKTPSDKAHIPSHWMSYVGVENIDNTLSKVQSLGGHVIIPKTAAGDKGHFAIIQDPTGAHIALWEVSTK